MPLHKEDYKKLNWEVTGGNLLVFDDGHTPELCQKSPLLSAPIPTRFVDYPDLFLREPPQVRVYADAFSEELVDSVYQKSLDCKRPTWGDYVTIEQIQRYWKTSFASKYDSDINADTSSLLIPLVARYLELAMKTEDCLDGDEVKYERIGPPGTFFTTKDLEHVHGVSVWSLRSSVGSEVSAFTCLFCMKWTRRFS
jgi:hypothetical protein